jgi:hypothetical protein
VQPEYPTSVVYVASEYQVIDIHSPSPQAADAEVGVSIVLAVIATAASAVLVRYFGMSIGFSYRLGRSWGFRIAARFLIR